MSPFWWIHGTLPHITVMVDDVTPATLTEEGPADGAENETVISCCIETLTTHTYWLGSNHSLIATYNTTFMNNLHFNRIFGPFLYLQSVVESFVPNTNGSIVKETLLVCVVIGDVVGSYWNTRCRDP
jgi:hypothetical protein